MTSLNSLAPMCEIRSIGFRWMVSFVVALSGGHSSYDSSV